MTDPQRNPGLPESLPLAVEARCAAGERFAPDLKAYIDGEMASPLRRFAITRHVAACAACRDEIEAMRETTDELRRAADAVDVALSPALRSRLLDAASEARRATSVASALAIPAAAAAPTAELPRREPVPLWRQRPALVLASGAAALALFVVIFVPLRQQAGSLSQQMPAADTAAVPPPPVVAARVAAEATKTEQQKQAERRPAPLAAKPTAPEAALESSRKEDPRAGWKTVPIPSVAKKQPAARESVAISQDRSTPDAEEKRPPVRVIAPRRRSLTASKPGDLPASATGNTASLLDTEKGLSANRGKPAESAVLAAVGGAKKEQAARTGEMPQSVLPDAGTVPGGFTSASGGFGSEAAAEGTVVRMGGRGGSGSGAPATGGIAGPPAAASAPAAVPDRMATMPGTRSAALPTGEAEEVTITLAVADVAQAEAKVRKIVAEADGTITEIRAESRRLQSAEADASYFALRSAPSGITSRVPADRVEEAVGKLALIGDMVDRKKRALPDPAMRQRANPAPEGSPKSRTAEPSATRGMARPDGREARRSPTAEQEFKRVSIAQKTTLIVRLVAKKDAPKAAEPTKKAP